MRAARKTSRSRSLPSPARAARTGAISCRTGAAPTSSRSIVFADWMIRLERQESLPRIVVRQLASGEEHTIAFAEEAYSLGAESGYEFATDRLRFHYSSMTTPNETWDYDLKTRARTLRKRQEVPSGHDPSAYVTRRLFATAPDGETRPDLDPASQGRQAGRHRALPALRLRRLRLRDAGLVLDRAALAGRSRLRLRDRACPRRHRQGLALVPGRQARRRNRTRSPTSSRRASISVGRDTPRRSSRMAARPAAC